ncbi:MAG: hypothetical protein N2234_03235 [Planctomycetota bacterium]|nr:hypothetical protein [Planctomycetota bacterium]
MYKRYLIPVSLFLVFLPVTFLSADEVEKYALLVIGCADTNTQLHPDLDPIDQNASEVQLGKLYGILTKCGFEDKNIRVLYAERGLQPNWNETSYGKELARIRKNHFNGQYDNTASKENIDALMAYFKQKVDENDIFIFYIMTHGHPSAVVQLAGKRMWKAEEMQTALSGLKSKTNIFCFETCHSGAILNRTDFPNAVCVAAAPAETPGWVDRTFANCVNFIEAKADTANDKNKDGKVDPNEAFEVTKKKAADYEQKWREYLKTKYKMPKNSPVPPNMVDKTSLNAVLEVGKDYEERSLFTANKEPVKKIVEKSGEKKHTPLPEKTENDSELLERADSLLREGKQLEAYELYERLSTSKDEKIAEQAKQRKEELLKDEKFVSLLEEAHQKEQVEKKLASARNYLENRMLEKARAICEEVIKENNGTKYAEEAQKLLEEIKQRENE